MDFTVCIPLTNPVRGSYSKLRPTLSPLRAWAINRREKQRFVIYSTDRENGVSLSLYLWIERAGKEAVSIQAERHQVIDLSAVHFVHLPDSKNKFLTLAGRTEKYSPLNWPITARILTERYNKNKDHLTYYLKALPTRAMAFSRGVKEKAKASLKKTANKASVDINKKQSSKQEKLTGRQVQNLLWRGKRRWVTGLQRNLHKEYLPK